MCSSKQLERALPDSAAAAQRILGLDIGGANLKAATTDRLSVSVPFAMWLHCADLAPRLVSLAEGLPACRAWAVTMTGEMADVFSDRGAGVRFLVQQTCQAAQRMGVEDVAFYSAKGHWVFAAEAVADPAAVASANWHALALWVATQIDAPSLLIDIGGTTTDIIPIESGRVATASTTDFDRLAQGELVYLGGVRTPVCSLVQHLPFAGRQVPVMREIFATIDDCALVLGLTDEDAEDRMTSDGGPRTVMAAVNRLGRMIGLDQRHMTLDSAGVMASDVITAAADTIAAAVRRHGSRYAGHWVLSGHTAEYFLPTLLAGRDAPRITRLSQQIGFPLSRVAPAYACAQLYSWRHSLEVEQGL